MIVLFKIVLKWQADLLWCSEGKTQHGCFWGLPGLSSSASRVLIGIWSWNSHLLGRTHLCMFIVQVSQETELWDMIVLLGRWSSKSQSLVNWGRLVSALSLFRSPGRQSFHFNMIVYAKRQSWKTVTVWKTWLCMFILLKVSRSILEEMVVKWQDTQPLHLRSQHSHCRLILWSWNVCLCVQLDKVSLLQGIH